MDQRYDESSNKLKEEKINPMGSVFQYEDGTEFKLKQKDKES